jgi:hypothetical protein
MLKSNFKYVLLLIFALLLTNPNHDEFVYQVTRYSYRCIKNDPEIEREYRLSPRNKKLSFEDKYATALAYEFRRSEAQNDLKVYNLLLFTVAMFTEADHDFYFISILKFSLSNFEDSFKEFQKEK